MIIDASSCAAERRAKRVKIFQCATLVLNGSSRRIHLLDVSVTGLRAHAQDPVAKDARVRVECFDVMRNATVQWSEGNRFGLLFDRELSTEQVAVLARFPSPRA